MNNKQHMEQGAVTLLDILGWKGIWQRKDDAIDALLKLIKTSQDKTDLMTNIDGKSKRAKIFNELKVEIKSISDTIALVTYGECNVCLEFHALINSIIIAQSIRDGIPVRGATSYGSFAIKDNIMVGPAIDEVASWYETANWIGVILTPSALFRVDRTHFSIDKDRLIEYEVITKKYGRIKTLCCNWPKIWNINKLSRNELLERFLDSTPILPEVYEKFINTLDYYDDILTNNVQVLEEIATAAQEK